MLNPLLDNLRNKLSAKRLDITMPLSFHLRLLGANKDSVGFKLIAACTVAVFMESIIAFALTSLQLGWQPGFGYAWAHALLLALPVGLAIGLTMVFWLEPKIHALITEGKRLQALKRSSQGSGR